MAISHQDAGRGDPTSDPVLREGSPTWSDLLVPAGWGPGVFDVATGYRSVVREWIERQDVPFVSARAVHAPSVEAWAVLDGGITSVYGYGLTSLPHGMRVVGFAAFRLVVDALGLAGPAQALPGETLADVTELRRRHRTRSARDPVAVEQAELLSVCQDAVMLRWVAAALASADVPATGGRC